MTKGLLERFRSREADEEGMALAGVVMLSAFVFIVVSSLMMTSLISTNLTSNNRSSVLTLSSAESGIDDAIVAASMDECTPTKVSEEMNYSYEIYRTANIAAPVNTTDSGVVAGCPEDGDRFVVIKSSGTDYRGKQTEIVSTYEWITRTAGTAHGAIVSGTTAMNLSRLNISGPDADLLLLGGNFDCNNITSLTGDLIVLGGTVSISNACKVGGSVYSTGDVKIVNPAVAVEGDVYTLGDFHTSTAATVGGTVYAKGNLDISSGTKILGSVISEGTGLANISGVTIGGNLRTAGRLNLKTGTDIAGNVYTSNTGTNEIYAVRIGGTLAVGGSFAQLQNTTVGATVTAGRAGVLNAIAPDVVSGAIYLGGTISTWGSGPAAQVTQNMTIPALTKPTFPVPIELQAGTYNWTDYKYKAADWTTKGYQILTKSSCDYKNNASLVAEVNNLVAPTVIDTRACGEVDMQNVTFNLKTDVTFIGNKFDASDVKVNSANSRNSNFNIIISDEVDDNWPTCSAGQGDLNIYRMVMASKISGIIYSGCQIKFGGESTVTGQIHGGVAGYNAGGAMTLDYKGIPLPGLPAAEGEADVTYDTSADTRAVPLLVKRTEN